MTSVGKRNVKVLLSALAIIGVAATAFLTASRNSRPSAAEDRTQAQRWLASTHFTMVRTPLPQLLTATDAVARIRVDSIEGPFWNTTDGRPWDGNTETPARVYSRVKATLMEQWMGSALPEQFEIMTLGDASVRLEQPGAPDYGHVSGGFVQGEEFLVLLAQEGFVFENRETTGWGLVGEFQGNWRLSADSAIRGDGLSTSVSTLRDAISRRVSLPGIDS